MVDRYTVNVFIFYHFLRVEVTQLLTPILFFQLGTGNFILKLEIKEMGDLGIGFRGPGFPKCLGLCLDN